MARQGRSHAALQVTLLLTKAKRPDPGVKPEHTHIRGVAYVTSRSKKHALESGHKIDFDLAGFVGFVAFGALEGAIFGAVIGGAVGAEKWTTIYSNPVRLRVRPAPSGATGIGLSIEV